MSRQRILALSFFPAYVPPRNGGVERLFRIYSLLSERFDVTLISSAEVGGNREVVEHSPSFMEIRVPKDGHFEDCYQELGLVSGDGDLSGPALGLASRRHGAIHDEYLAHYAAADFIIHDSPFLVECDLFRGFDDKVRIYNSYNFETGLYRSFHSEGDEGTAIEDLVEELERDLCQHVNLITACSKDDREAFESAFAPVAPIILLPNGFYPQVPSPSSQRETSRVIFLGSNHKPNVDAARRIVDELAPALPRIEFHLVGSCHPRMRKGNVVAHGVVDGPTKAALLGSATLAINPIESGSGSSLKIADIAVSGTPLLSTTLGARGFDVEPGRHYFPLDADDLVGSLKTALGQCDELQALGERARIHFLSKFAWPAIVQTFADQIDQLRVPDRSAAILVVNDYDSLRSTGGGATRTSGLCRGLAEHAPVIFLAFNGDEGPTRRVSPDGRILSLLVDKTRDHLAEHAADNLLHWMSTADIVNYLEAPRNERMLGLFRCAASISQRVVCEHPYMVSLPKAFGIDFVYSSQNFEFALKSHSLRDHPRFAERIATVHEAEQFACGASSLIIAVSEDDARGLSGSYRFTAPIKVIENGADGPHLGKLRPKKGKQQPKKAPSSVRPTAIFMGSAHGPNVEAAQWIAGTLAPAMPDLDFAILGSVAENLTGKLAPNVRLIGQVSAKEKTRNLYAAQVALNPMQSGSGSNVKMADYLQHGLPVVSTGFGARGYTLPTDDVVVTDLDAFQEEVRSMLASTAVRPASYAARQERYLAALSMEEGGRKLHRLIEDEKSETPKALYVTYRYNSPARGGGEEHVVRLVHALAADGWAVDVVSPAAEIIQDVARFGAVFSADDFQPVPTGKIRVRSAKFDLDTGSPARVDLQQFWRVQPVYERAYLQKLERQPLAPSLAWGWADAENGGRWCLKDAGLYAPNPGRLLLAADPLASAWVQVLSQDGALVYDMKADGPFRVECDVPAGFIQLRAVLQGAPEIEDPRPLAFFTRRIELGAVDLIADRPMDNWAAVNSSVHQLICHAQAREETRDQGDLRLGKVRNPSRKLDHYVRENVAKYDLLITHNAVFGNPIEALRSAKAQGTPSIYIPHLHMDDDFYHFRDVMESCATATKTLVCPSVTKDFLEAEGLQNLIYHTPGIDTDVTFDRKDAEAFRQLIGSDQEFFLVLGRKAAAKGYRDVIRAAESVSAAEQPLIVLIGPDDDGAPVRSDCAIYLGMQPRSIVRGALMECLALVNMSRSESFGMVLLEAGAAGKPVLANRQCAAFIDIVEDGVTGFLVSQDNLGQRMIELSGSDDLRRRMGEIGRERARRYSWATIEQDFVRLCNSTKQEVK